MKDWLLTSSPRVIHILTFSCEIIFSYISCNLSLWAFATVFFPPSVCFIFSLIVQCPFPSVSPSPSWCLRHSQEKDAQARKQLLEEERKRREEVERRLQEETAHRQRLVEEEVKMREKQSSQVSAGLRSRQT